MNATKLRADLYTVLDAVLRTGVPIVIERNGRRLKICVDDETAPKKRRDIRQLKPRPEWFNGDPEAWDQVDWMVEWREEWGITKREGATKKR